MFKKFLSGIMAVVLCVVGLSGCGESQTEETETIRTETITHKTTTLSEKTQTTKPTETTIIETTSEETTTTEYELTDEDLELLNSMPEIVFVMSHHYDGSNIRGLFVTNTGEMKIYDFGQTAPDETYEIPDVYDKLEEAVCSEIVVDTWYTLKADDLVSVPKNKIIECYSLLLKTSGEISKINPGIITGEDIGHFRLYGIRNNIHNKKEFILLSGNGDGYRYFSNDSNSTELDYELYMKIFGVYFNIYN